MSKRAQPDSSELSTTETAKSALEIKKDSKSDVQPEKSVLSNTQSIEPSLETITEFGGQKGPEPTRYGDWEKNGRCTDF